MSARQVAMLVLVLAGLALFVALDLGRYLSLQALKEAHAALSMQYAERPVQTVAAYMAVYVVGAALSLPVATVLSLAAGAVFGRGTGLLVASVSATAGALLAMLVARHLLRDAVARLLGARMDLIDRGIARDGAFHLFLLRAAPVFPFFVVNLVMGLTAMRVWTYTWVTQLGLLGGTFLYVNAGTELARLESLQDLWSPTLVASLVLLGVAPLAVRALALRWLARHRQGADA